MRTLIYNGLVVNAQKTIIASIIIEDGKILEIKSDIVLEEYSDFKIFDATGLVVMPGIIDTHVHFREPGVTEKADMYSESKAAVAGGITTFFDMPNTIPQTTTIETLNQKFTIASKKSLINYSFYIGATNDNQLELEKINPKEIVAIKLFYASSTGNMLVDKKDAIEELFKNAKIPVVIHSEEQQIIEENYRKIKSENDVLLAEHHEFIRSAKSCELATKFLVNLSKKFDTKIHFAHITTANELEFFSSKKLKNKKITAEVSPNHLFFDNWDYKTLKMQIKCNPSVKSKNDKNALFSGLLSNKIDTIATDHAPHVFEDKLKSYDDAPSGIPSIQHSLNIMLEFVKNQDIKIEQLVEKMCHNPAIIFDVEKRGFIEKGYWADIVIVDMNNKWKVSKNNIFYKCAWSPIEGKEFSTKVIATFVNGNIIYENGKINEIENGKKVEFDR